ncbi:MAG TPA: glycosyltransferase family 2 protein [Acidiphilium sp.]|nr:MAG: hypothetical protein B7Z67_12910 [Acidiphilium sp. 21-60-14]OZB40146.1 MAG: hypothetical protein B7X48_06145 [Acidiphilium sp. 34-60-192]HQT87850.1 glycosyltransferase family 2 protein [Acidiphilium sp.]HQU25075.1 glycosyltransferase family 2 protein [Acidiphilium sp.]
MSDTVTTWQSTIAALDAKGDAAGALLALQRHVFTQPNDADAAFELAHRFKAQSLISDALALLAPLTNRDGHYLQFRALLESAACEQARENFSAAEIFLRRAHAADPGSHWPILRLAELFARSGRVSERLPLIEATYESLRPDGRAEIARHAAEFTAYDHFNQTRHRPDWRPHMPGHVPALAKAGLIMMVKDEADIITQNLEHHYALGFRTFCLLDNGSTDATAAKIEAFRKTRHDALILTINDPIVGYYQSAKMDIFQQALIRYAAITNTHLDWMFFIDADEFIAYTGPDNATGIAALNAELTDPNAHLLVLHWLHAASHTAIETPPDLYDPFILHSKFTSRLLPVVPKIAFRTNLGLAPMMGNHFIANFFSPLATSRPLAIADWYMAHFPLRSLDHARSKVINGGKAFRNSQGLETHGGHWRERYALYEKHGDTIIRQLLEQHIRGIQ